MFSLQKNAEKKHHMMCTNLLDSLGVTPKELILRVTLMVMIIERGFVSVENDMN